MSFPINHLQTNPRARFGVHLGELPEPNFPDLIVHECGFLPRGVADWNQREMISSFWRLWYNRQGGHRIAWDGGELELTPQQLVLVPSGVIFDTFSEERIPHFWMHFSLVLDYTLQAASPFSVIADNALRAQIEAIIACHLAAPGEQTQEQRRQALYHHAVALLHGCFARRPLSLRALPAALHELLHAIETTPRENFSNARLARRAGMSVSTFTRWFAAHLGVSPAAHVQRMRLDQASRLLAFSDDSIEGIAAELGFANRHYFSRVFARHAGCGPATFRKRHQSRHMAIDEN